MVTAIRKVNTEINFPESPASFYSIGQGSACSGVLQSAHIKGADPRAAGQLHQCIQLLLCNSFFLSFSLTRLFSLWPNRLLKSFQKSQADLKFHINLPLQLAKTVSRNCKTCCIRPVQRLFYYYCYF